MKRMRSQIWSRKTRGQKLIGSKIQSSRAKPNLKLLGPRKLFLQVITHQSGRRLSLHASKRNYIAHDLKIKKKMGPEFNFDVFLSLHELQATHPSGPSLRTRFTFRVSAAKILKRLEWQWTILQTCILWKKMPNQSWVGQRAEQGEPHHCQTLLVVVGQSFPKSTYSVNVPLQIERGWHMQNMQLAINKVYKHIPHYSFKSSNIFCF